jgi:hypothetical protein
LKELEDRCDPIGIKPYDVTHAILNGKDFPTWKM